MRSVLIALAAVLGSAAPASTASPSAAVRIVLGGDVMLGRGVAPLAASRPAAVLAGVAVHLQTADLAVANLESPLTLRRHEPAHGPNALEARPATAKLLAKAGFDALALANNHAGDAGPATVPDTLRALRRARLRAVGAGANDRAAFTPLVLTEHGVRVAFLSFDGTGEGPRAGPARAGVAWWSATRARAAVGRARREADVVVVGLHGGSDYNPTTDPWLLHLGRLLAGWGADVVWGTGPHVVQPVRVVRAGGRVAVVATSLGNLVFDQHLPGTRSGALLEVLAGRDGVRAYRVGTTHEQPSNAVDFGRWLLPHGDAAAVGGAWWTLPRDPVPAPSPKPPVLDSFPGRVAAAAVGDVEGNGGLQLVVSFWRRYRRTDVNALLPRSELVDRRGLTAHVGVYGLRDRRQLWVAGTLLSPVAALAACDGALGVSYTALNGQAVVATGAWQWRGFGFSPLPTLTGRATPACADVDGDGRLDPVILDRR